MNRRSFMKLGAILVPVVAAPTVAYSFLWDRKNIEHRPYYVYQMRRICGPAEWVLDRVEVREWNQESGKGELIRVEYPSAERYPKTTRVVRNSGGWVVSYG